MSRIGAQIIRVPASVTIDQHERKLVVRGPRGSLSALLPAVVHISKDGEGLTVTVDHPEEKEERALWGTWASHLKNMIKGVTDGFTKELEINGVGYKVAVIGKKLVLSLGFSHPVEFTIPDGIETTVEKNVIKVSGSDKQLVGQVASEIRSLRPVEPYKGKGIKYVGEVVRRKAGKAAKGVGAA